jgi:hypothetical protein
MHSYVTFAAEELSDMGETCFDPHFKLGSVNFSACA